MNINFIYPIPIPNNLNNSFTVTGSQLSNVDERNNNTFDLDKNKEEIELIL